MLFLHILKILLLILVGIIVIAGFTIAFIPLRVEVRKKIDDKPIKIRISIGFIKIVRSFGGKKKKKKEKPKKPAKKPPKKKKEKKQKKGILSDLNIKNIDVPSTIELVFDILDDLMGSLTFEKLYITVILHKDDAAKTGELLGTLSALTGLIYPELERRFVLKDPKIVIDADFEAEGTVWSTDISILTRAGRYVRILLRRRKQLWRLWKDLKRKNPENGKNNTENQGKKEK